MQSVLASVTPAEMAAQAVLLSVQGQEVAAERVISFAPEGTACVKDLEGELALRIQLFPHHWEPERSGAAALVDLRKSTVLEGSLTHGPEMLMS